MHKIAALVREDPEIAFTAPAVIVSKALRLARLEHLQQYSYITKQLERIWKSMLTRLDRLP
jgi:hypothetical protein